MDNIIIPCMILLGLLVLILIGYIIYVCINFKDLNTKIDDDKLWNAIIFSKMLNNTMNQDKS